jgi:hypothetical protein
MGYKHNNIVEHAVYKNTIYKYGGSGRYTYHVDYGDVDDIEDKSDAVVLTEEELHLTRLALRSEILPLIKMIKQVAKLKFQVSLSRKSLTSEETRFLVNVEWETERLLNLSLADRYREEAALKQEIVDLEEKVSASPIDKTLESFNYKVQRSIELERKRVQFKENFLYKRHVQHIEKSSLNKVKSKQAILKKELINLQKDQKQVKDETLEKAFAQKVESYKREVSDIAHKQTSTKNVLDVLFKGSKEERRALFSKQRLTT